MNKYTLLLLAAALVAAHSTTLRGSSLIFEDQKSGKRQEQGQLASSYGRRLMKDSTCTLYRKCVFYGPTEEHPNGYHKDSLVCELSEEDASRINAQFVDIVETDNISERIVNVTSGESTLTVSEAIIDTDSPRMFIPDSARITVGDSNTPIESRTEKRRKLYGAPPRIGTLKTLVIRVKDRNNVAPTASIEKLRNDVFEDSSSLKTQTEACSYGKLKIEPFVGKTPLNKNINNGIVEIKMDFDIKVDNHGLDQAAIKAAMEQIGDLEDPMFDLIMFCMPPGKDGYIAFAYPETKYSFYNNDWCGYVSTQMHEVGHNLGLAHSGQNGQGEYGDVTGVMGSASGDDDKRMCFNPQKNYQLGWYKDKAKTINPLDGKRHEYTLNGVADYKRNNDALIVLRLDQVSRGQDYYVGFNRAAGIHSETMEDANMITIVRKEFGGPNAYGISTKVASLIPGQVQQLNNFDGKKNVYIKFAGVKNGDARLIVSDNINHVQSQQPTNHCKKFTIEINTDDYPQDTGWFVVDDSDWGEAAAHSPKYTDRNQKYRHQICLPMGPQAKTYKFTIFDIYKDGMLGTGSYKAFDENNKLIFSGGKDLVLQEHSIQVPRDLNPRPASRAPTTAPTAKPTPTPPCETHIVEIITDRYPDDNSWKIFTNGNLVDESKQQYRNQEAKYTQEVCLFEGKTYDFNVYDKYGDGLCCGNGKGKYRIIDNCGNAIIDSDGINEKFGKKSHAFKVKTCGTIVAPDLTNNHGKCQDKEGKFVLRQFKKKERKGRTCKIYAAKGKCDKKLKHTGELVWQLCPASCNKCSN